MKTPLTDCPSVGDTLTGGRTVIASGYVDEDGEEAGYGLLLLDTNAEFNYSIVLARPSGDEVLLATHRNIVPIVKYFDETFGFWGGS